jgi:hypothetical protein
MYANTITVTIDSTDRVLTRVQEDKNGSLYRLKSATELFELKFRHSVGSSNGVAVNRHNVIFEHTVFATVSALETKHSHSVTITETNGVDPSDEENTIIGLVAAMASLWDTFVIGEQ